MLALLLTSFNNYNSVEISNKKFVVVLDAGHGGHDPGNLGNGYLEKDIALSIVLKVGAILERNPDIEVIYTRNDDTFVDLFVRGEIANKANADLFVSVHCDSHTSDAHGAGTFVLGLHANKQNFQIAKKENSVIYLEDNYETRYADYDINSPESVIGLTIMQEEFLDQSISLAKTIQDNFTNKLNRKNREVKQAGFIVLHQTFMPSVLVETGFLTNNDEGAYLNSKRGQIEMGTAVAEAILSYLNGVKSSFDPNDQKVIMPVPDPEKKIVSVKKRNKDKQVDDEIAETKDAVVNSNSNASITKEKAKEIEKKTPSIKPQIAEVEKEAVVIEQSKTVKAIEKPKSIVVENKEVVAPVEEISKPEKPISNIKFRVQLLATSKDLPLSSSRFNGLNQLSKEPYGNLLRYMYGNVDSFEEAQALKRNANQSGYKTCFIVAYKNEVRIHVSKALKLVSEK